MPVPPETRAAYLPELGALVWPDATVEIGRRAGAAADTFVVVPHIGSPRILVPAQGGRAAAASVRYATEAGRGKQKLRREAVATLFRLGLGGLAFRDRVHVSRKDPDSSLDTYLTEALGRRVAVSLPIGPARANRKPILQLVAPDGTLIGYAKLGVNELTRQLVRAETEALRALAEHDLAPIQTAEVLHHGEWRGHALLVQGALPVWEKRAPSDDATAMAVLATAFGTQDLPYASSSFGKRMGEAIADLADHPNGARLAAIHQLLVVKNPSISYGTWHGDWHDGNSATLTDGRVLLWDWERFAHDVPVGWDRLHAHLQHTIHKQWVDPAPAADDLLTRAAALVEPFGIGPEPARYVAALYLLEIAVRYSRDRQAEAGARTGRVDLWLLPALDRHLQS